MLSSAMLLHIAVIVDGLLALDCLFFFVHGDVCYALLLVAVESVFHCQLVILRIFLGKGGYLVGEHMTGLSLLLITCPVLWGRDIGLGHGLWCCV
jgi:hypothetical protein